MSRAQKEINLALFGFGNCEVPKPQSADSSKDDPKEEPIIFDESENPMLLEMQKKFPLRPPTFEMLLQPLRLATMVEPLEGVKVDLGLGLSQRLQFSNSWVLPHGQGGSYDVTFMFAGGKMANPYDFVSPNPFLMGRLNPGLGRQDLKLVYKLNEKIESRLTANYLSRNPQESHVQLEADYIGHDFIAGGKVGLGLEFVALNYIQSLTKSLVFGFEITGMRKPRQLVGYGLGAKYSYGSSQFYAQYLQMQDMLHLGAVVKGNQNITFTSELVYSGAMNKDFDFTLGASVRFLRAKFNAQVSGSGRLSSSLTHAVNPLVKVSLHAEADLMKMDQKFGLGLLLGSG
jgi:hypothetical protein